LVLSFQNQHYPYKNQLKRSNAEFMNGLLQMDLDRISEVGKRSNAEFINGLIGMNLKGIHDAGRKR
uniref:ISLre2 family transposase n=1 Tax=Rhabditophanes sp. KR3021 TaxID=114890 RepID=A0AC35TI24_9BILA